MYLTRLLLNGDQLHNPYEIHRALWQTFPNAPEQSRDFLFRVEQKSSHQAQVLIQSQRQPKDIPNSARLLTSKEIELNLLEGIRLNFFLIANPTKTITDEQGRLNKKGKPKKCRVPLIKVEQQIDWLIRKLNSSAVVDVESVTIDKLPPLNFRKDRKRGKVQPYSFKGILQVNDPSLLESAIKQGIGPAKAFGCGLLSLARW